MQSDHLKQSIPVFIWLILLGVTQSFGQPAEGVYLSSHSLRVGNFFSDRARFRVMEVTPAMRAAFPDSLHSKGGEIAQVHGDGKLSLLHDIRAQEIMAEDADGGSGLAFGRDTYQLESVSTSKLMLVNRYSDSLRWEKHFHKLAPSALDADSDILLQVGAQLRLRVSGEVDTYLHFTDEKHLVVTGFEDGKPYTYAGRWHTKWIGSHFFLAFYDYHFDRMRICGFHAKKGEELEGVTLGSPNNPEVPPQLVAVAVGRLDTLGISARKILEQHVVGAWTAINEPLFYDTAIEFGFLSFQHFELELRADGHFASHSSGSLLKFGDSIPLEYSLSGKWEIDPTGKYIMLTMADAPPQYLTLEEALPDALRLTAVLKTLSEYPDYNVYQNRRIELRK